jgi:FemAB-related protein (PEP-CTERM system-associated)
MLNADDSCGGFRVSVTGRPGADWSSFVAGHPAATLYHTVPWLGVATEAFGCQTFYVEARGPDGVLAGVLPLVRQRTLAFGDRLTSLPYCNYGGPLAVSDEAATALMERATKLGAQLGVSCIELRDSAPRDTPWSTRTDKVTFELKLPATAEAMGKALGSKLRSQIRRSDREAIAIRTGAEGLLGDFYGVFAENMRDLGTPVYPRRFFDVIAQRLRGQFQVIIVDLDGAAAAAGFVFFFRDVAEIPWAACTRKAKARSVNMRLYWEALLLSMAHGAGTFDFGRCSVGSGTYRFKQQWGGEPRPLHWHRWPHSGAVEGSAAEGHEAGVAVRAWQRLPLWLANALGPLISPGLPW